MQVAVSVQYKNGELIGDYQPTTPEIVEQLTKDMKYLVKEGGTLTIQQANKTIIIPSAIVKKSFISIVIKD